MKRSIQQSFSVPFTYQVLFDRDIFNPENHTLQQQINRLASVLPAKVYVVIDEGVAQANPLLIPQILAYSSEFPDSMQLVVEPMLVTGGEAIKNQPEWVDKMLADVDQYGIDRHSFIIGIGGGAVLDTVGYAASIAHRGIRHIRIPTTVLSQNDSGVGVKNGINAFGKKNFIGNFAPPHAVINDSQFLETLGDRDWRAGISEAVKVALIKDLDFFEQIEQDAQALFDRQMPEMESLIFRCAEMHLDHIASGDPFEMGNSRPLDFGHWSAHKLEQMTDYALRHGEAVAIGIALDVCYSWRSGRISEEDCRRVLNTFQLVGLPIFHEMLQARDNRGVLHVLNGLEEFREHLGGQLTIMILEALGQGVEVHEMNPIWIEEAIQYLQSYELQPTT
ncbi:3-dehydroquinate synthase [Pontibacter sp. G13]|uniref:3-dehydroquinate synthase n=1 Tax=Pontibacter sp. G13 TaxID=3074898 RepID=UPI002889BE4E|nr:3-dehydroquinate synthase [Pontibacter sp. G13]WNJ20608.1 3-dehydroquinate synthase [Pontibacter sp. G13]